MKSYSSVRRKSEDNLGEAEQALDSQTRTLESLTRRVEEQNLAAAQVTKLKDQLDECVSYLLLATLCRRRRALARTDCATPPTDSRRARTPTRR